MAKTVLTNNGIVVDENGEVVEINGNTNYRITIEEFSEDAQNQNDNIKLMDGYSFIKSFRGNGVMLTRELTPNEIYAVMFLTDFISYKDCVLRSGGRPNGNALTIKDLSRMIGIKYETFRKTMGSLKKKV